MNKKKVAALALGAVFVLSGCQASQIDKGVEYLNEENYEKAAESFSEAVQNGKSEELGQAYKGLGMAYWEMGEYTKARESLEGALENGVQETASLYNLMACSAMEEEKFAEAQGYFEKGLALEEDSKELVQEMKYNQVICYEKQAKWGEAKEAIEAYVKEYPDDEKAAREAQFLRTR